MHLAVLTLVVFIATTVKTRLTRLAVLFSLRTITARLLSASDNTENCQEIVADHSSKAFDFMLGWTMDFFRHIPWYGSKELVLPICGHGHEIAITVLYTAYRI